MSLFRGEHPVLGDFDVEGTYLDAQAESGQWNFQPLRTSSLLPTQQYGVRLQVDNWFTGTANGAHSFGLGVTGDRTVAGVGTDLNDAYIRATGSNYALNTVNHIYRGVNVSIVNRSGGRVGELDGATFTADTRSGSTTTTIIGLIGQADVGDCQSGSTVLAADFTLRRQAATTPTTEAGIRIRNRSLGNQASCAIKVAGEDGTIVGFTRLIDASGTQKVLKVTSGKVTLAAIDISGTTYYVRASNAAVSVEANES
jgi:hypothetical protein